MGCAMTTAPRPRPKVQPLASAREQAIQPVDPQVAIIEMLKNDFTSILQGFQYLPKPDKTGPVVCFSDKSLPLIVAPLALEEGDSTGVTLPVMALSHYQNGRAVVLGSDLILLQCTRDNTDASAFLENLIKWTSGITRGRIAMQIDGFLPEITEQLIKNVSGFGFKVQSNPTEEQYLKTHVLVIPSDYQDPNGLIPKYVAQGGGVIAALSSSKNSNSMDKYNINKSLGICGVGFPVTNLQVGPVNSQFLRISTNLQTLTDCRLEGIANIIKDILSKDQFDIKDLDAAITAARYNIMCMPQSMDEILLDLHRSAFEFIEKLYNPDEGICPDLIQCVVAVLLCEIQSKLAAEAFVDVDQSATFPGTFTLDFDQEEEHSVSIQIERAGWYTTGYWLPAGHMAKVSLKTEVQGSFTVQVGSHTEVLLSKPGPWKRWPMVTTSFEMKSETDVSSPFGGIVYIVPMSQDCIGQTVELTIDHVAPYPRFSIAEPSLWEETRDSPIAWAEVRYRRVIYTLPAEAAAGLLESRRESLELLDNLVDHISGLMSDSNRRVFRVVFDVELCDADPVCGYPIVMPLEALDAFFSTEPSDDVFVFLAYIGILSAPEGAFEPDKEAAVGHVAACAAFMSAWPGVSPLDYSHLMLPPLFNELWNVYKKDAGSTFATSMRGLRDGLRSAAATESVDGWRALILEIQQVSGLDLSHLLPQKEEDAGPSGVVSSMSSASLQAYQMHDDF